MIRSENVSDTGREVLVEYDGIDGDNQIAELSITLRRYGRLSLDDSRRARYLESSSTPGSNTDRTRPRLCLR